MATFKIPNTQGQVRQLGYGDIAGELWASKNIDLATSPGKIKLARPLTQLLDSDDLFDLPIEAIELYSEKIYALSDAFLYSAPNPFSTFTQASSGPADAQDMAVYGSSLLVSEATDIAKWNGASYDDDWWTTVISGTALTSGVPHILKVSRAGGRDTVAVTDGARLRYYNSTSGHTSFTWDADLIACSQTFALGEGWVGTYSTSGKRAEVIRWRIGDDNYYTSYDVDASAILSMETWGNTPVLITERGEVMVFNSAGFDVRARLPFYREPDNLTGVLSYATEAGNTARAIHPKGMRVDGDTLLVFVNTEGANDNYPINERAPSGVFEVDLNTGSVTHRFSIGNESRISKSGPVFVLNDDNARVYCGGVLETPFDGSTRGEEGLWRENLTADAANDGYFITVEMHSQSVLDTFEKALVVARKQSGDSFTVKYRTGRNTSLPVKTGVYWTSATTFTTTSDLSDVLTAFDSETKNIEVEFLTDTGAGKHAQVTNIEQSTNTYTVTIDDATIGTNGDISRVQFDEWRAVSHSQIHSLVAQAGLNEVAPFIQCKVWLSGSNGFPEVSAFAVKSNNKNTF